MSRVERLATANPAPAAKTFHDRLAGLPHDALALLPALHREAGQDLHLWRFIAASPQFCVALMLQGTAMVIYGGAGTDMADQFGWVMAVLLGIAAVTRNHILGFARSPRQMSLFDTAWELRALLLYIGLSWGMGAFLILPPGPATALVFTTVSGATAALILKDEKATAAFILPMTLLVAMASLKQPHGLWATGAILITGLGFSGVSMLRCAMLRRAPELCRQDLR